MPVLASVATWDNGPEVPDACILFGVSWCLPMCHERGCAVLFLLCNIRLAIPKLTPHVPRMRLCSSLFIVKSSPSSNTSEDLSFLFFLETIFFFEKKKNKLKNDKTKKKKNEKKKHLKIKIQKKTKKKKKKKRKNERAEEQNNQRTKELKN